MKSNLIYRKPLTLDYLEHKIEAKGVFERLECYMYQFLKRTRLKGDQIDTTSAQSYLESLDVIAKGWIKNIFSHCEKNHGFIFYLSSMYGIDRASKYVTSLSLSKVLTDVDLDVDTSFFPENMNYYLEIPGLKDMCDRDVVAIFVKSTRSEGKRFIDIGITSKESNGSMPKIGARIEVIPGKLLSDSFRKPKHSSEIDTIRINQNGAMTFFFKERSFLKTIFNALIYINSHPEDVVRQFQTKVSNWLPKKLRPDKQRKDLYFVGHSFSKMILKGETRCSVRGHFRWQPYGVKRRKVKLIYIKTHSRRLHNTSKTG
jgi:hypothetical protein